ncbi:acyl carrier protein [Kineococcus esterisolvens]|uniref:acyl carrier protein n=1 Tax=unclassified Kineococcus TaxID=2621656 RepID=UPI003D7D13D1
MDQDVTRAMMDEILQRQGKAPTGSPGASLREIGFRSLDFSELALRVEDEVGRELNFEADELRGLHTVADVTAFFERHG